MNNILNKCSLGEHIILKTFKSILPTPEFWMIVFFVSIVELKADVFFQVNSVKDLRILLEEDGLSSHYGDNKMSAAEEQPLNPTPKEHSLAEKSCPQVG